MAEYLIKGTTLTSIADAIREKTGTSEEMKTVDFPDKIRSITTGGGIDFDPSDENLKYFTYQLDTNTRQITLFNHLAGDIKNITGSYNVHVPDKIGGYQTVINDYSYLYGFFANSSANIITLGNNIGFANHIMNRTFMNCRYLNCQITVPNGVTSMSETFNGC